MSRRPLLVLVPVVLALFANRASAGETFDVVHTSSPAPGVVVHRIDQPNVKRATTDYPRVTFAKGDYLVLKAGGCAQTGGHGATWKRYLDPQGSDADRHYAGTVDLAGTTSGYQRIAGWAGHTMEAQQSAFLKLGYQDSNYDDNGYWGHDDGTGDQCRGVGNAWVEVTVASGDTGRAWVQSHYGPPAPGRLDPEAGTLSTQVPAPGVTVYRIDRPSVRRATMDYGPIAFEPNDVVGLEAGGCVQTGGSGKTWKRYISPQGRNTDRLYSGLVQIDGTIPSPQHIHRMVNRPIVIRAPATLRLGYQDDNYGDNGYDSHDEGTAYQCDGIGNAWVTVTLGRGAAGAQWVREHFAAPTTQPACKSPAARYNEVRQVSSHNSYDRCGMNPLECTPKRDLWLQAEYGVRSFELDLHHGDRRGEWAVYHATNTISGGNHCETLTECFQYLGDWHDAHPGHEPITIWYELKDKWEDGWKPVDLDRRFQSRFGAALFTPSQLLARCPAAHTLQQAVQMPGCGWPTVDELRGRVMMVLMGDNGEEANYLDDVNGYRGAPNNGYDPSAGRVSFVGPDIPFRVGTTVRNVMVGRSLQVQVGDLPPPASCGQLLTSEPKATSGRKVSWADAVFFNLHNKDGLDYARCTYDHKVVTRIWRIDGQDEWTPARASRGQHLATDEVMSAIRTPRAVDACGKPFEVIAP
jgi:hypothetical protein